MDDPLDPNDRLIVTSLRDLVDGAVEPRDTTVVVASVSETPRRRWAAPKLGLTATAGLAAIVVLVASAGAIVMLSGKDASWGTIAVVNELRYTVSGARGFEFPAGALAPYAEATLVSAAPYDEATLVDDNRLVGPTAYSIRGIDPSEVLLMKLKPGASDGTPLGPYLLLVRGPDDFAPVCPYFNHASEFGSPPECQ